MEKNTTKNQCLKFRQKTRSFDDCCAVDVRNNESVGPGEYQTNNFYRKCGEPVMTTCMNDQVLVFPKVYGNVPHCEVDGDSILRYAPLTNIRDINQLFTRPYKDAGYKGAGANNGHLKDLESALLQGQYHPHSKKELDNTKENYVDKFQYLPECNNPQRIQHIIMPITRGGVLTRELVRRLNFVDYNNSLNNARGYVGLEYVDKNKINRL